LECGVESVNSFAVTGPEAPFGGYKESGIGHEGGEESLDFYMITTTVLQRNEMS
jgi:succinate-semialdehyde dehydrogenase/glutarate-semialdehyde dehydrogenase